MNSNTREYKLKLSRKISTNSSVNFKLHIPMQMPLPTGSKTCKSPFESCRRTAYGKYKFVDPFTGSDTKTSGISSRSWDSQKSFTLRYINFIGEPTTSLAYTSRLLVHIAILCTTNPRISKIPISSAYAARRDAIIPQSRQSQSEVELSTIWSSGEGRPDQATDWQSYTGRSGRGPVHINSEFLSRLGNVPRERLLKPSFIPTFFEHPHPNPQSEVYYSSSI
jgi:hypothetical protein